MNIVEFSKRLNVSTATVSRAFSGKDTVGVATSHKILSEAARVGFRLNTNSAPHAKEINSITFFYSSFSGDNNSSYLISDIYSGMLEGANKLNAQLYPYMIMDHYSNFPEFYKNIISLNTINSIILLAESRFYKELLSLARCWKIPHIVINNRSMDDENCVYYDIEEGARKLGKYMKSSGYKKAVFFGPEGMNDVKLRGLKSGFENELKIMYSGSDFEDGAACFNTFKSLNEDFDCVFCANDIIAVGFMNAALEAGVKVPEDIGVAGFDGSRFSNYTLPRLTTVKIPVVDAGNIAIKKLSELRKIKTLNISHKINCELIVREST